MKTLSYALMLILLTLPALAIGEIKDSTGTSAMGHMATSQTTTEPLGQCARLVSECFGDNTVGESETSEIANCLYSSAKHPFCEGTSLGQLTYQRWLMSPVRIGGVDQNAPSFLGPKMVDQECLKKFDAFFVSSLVKVSELETLMAGMQEKLKGCTKEQSPNLARP